MTILCAGIFLISLRLIFCAMECVRAGVEACARVRERLRERRCACRRAVRLAFIHGFFMLMT